MNKKLTCIITLALLMINGMALAQDPPAHVTVGGSVFGGGNKAPVGRGTTVLIDQEHAVITGDVYGGGAKAEVDTIRKASPVPAVSVGDSTVVSILKGSVVGDVYGGGLGNADTAANVYGPVLVNIGSGSVNGTTGLATSTSGSATLGGSVYGCNNLKGTPKDNVFVNVFQTAHTDDNTYPDPIPSLEQLLIPAADNAFAIKAVYGGGNKAAYAPVDNDKTTQVHIYTCLNTIQTVYGGGNAADATKVHTIIDGGRFDRVFGGGNGYSANHNHDDPTQLYYNPGANISVSATTDIHGGLYRQVFGGSNQFGDVEVALLSFDEASGCAELIAEAFGGANEANIQSNITTNIACSDVQFGNFYGGSNLADITGNVTLNVSGGHFTNVFGGSKGYKDPADENNDVSADINGDVTLNLFGGTMDNAFGGSDVNGNITGLITVNMLDQKATNCGLQVDTLYGGGRDAAYTPSPSLVNGEKIVSPVVNLWNGTIGHDAIHGCVFGGGKGETAVVTAHPKVMIGDTLTGHESNQITVYYNGSRYGNIFGGGNAAAVDGIDSVLMLKPNSQVGNLFGGGNAANADSTVVIMNEAATVDTIFGGGNLAGLAGSALVTVTNGTVKGGIYGGSNADGTVIGDITVNVTGSASNHTTVGDANASANIHGGGYGASTRTNGNVTVNFGNNPDTRSEYPKVYGDIYGGSALGWVNDGNDTTMVNILNGEVKKTTSVPIVGGNVYGGGLGDKANSIAALVKGKALVNIGTIDASDNLIGEAVIEGSVFGCNNQLGTPQDSVFVNVYSTHHGDSHATNAYPNDISSLAALATNSISQTYAIESVYGGGNLAAYTPELSNEEPRSATVHVYGCDSNTIKEVYGGGNAADVGTTGTGAKNANTFVVIDGGRINRVFGGGKGVKNTTAANIYGTATTTINAGLIDTIFGGSNMNGNIDSISLKLAHVGTCTEIFNQVYGGANVAVLTGDLSTTIECGVDKIGDIYGGSNLANINGNVELNIRGGQFTNVFGGSKGASGTGNGADISGNVSLNLEGGSMVNAFGGSNVQGNIAGYITVNVLDTVTSCGLQVDTIYGGGQDAAYTPNPVAGKKIVSPVVNLWNGTVGHSGVNGCVFGGGKGSTAVVTAHPKVIVGDTIAAHSGYVATVLGNVFGGGNAAEVDGIDSVLMLKANNIVTNLFGGGNEALADSTVVRMIAGAVDTIFGGGNKAGLNCNALVTLVGGTVNIGIFGGCNTSGTVADSTKVIITGGTVGDANATIGAIYGGGYGADTKVKGDVIVNIDGGTINNDVYGGSAKGLVNCNDDGDGATAGSTTEVALNAGTINGSLYGGGHGISGADAHVWGPVQVTVNGGTVTGAVYGCNNVNGAPQSTVKVDIYGTDTPALGYALGNVFGGGNQAAFGGTPEVTIHNCDNSIGYVYGGGNKASVGNTLVKVYGGNTIGYVFAGGNGDGMGTNTMVSGNAAASIYGGTIAHVFGGNNHAGTIDGTTAVHVNKETETGHESCAMKVGEVYGGGNEADGNAGTIDIDCTGTWTDAHNNHNSTTNRIGYELEGIGTVYGGANNANINNSITVTINSGIVENVFGGNNLDGTISGSIQVEIDSTSGSNTCSWYVGNVYGGGNQATYGTGGDSPVVNIKRGLVSGDVFGGGLGLSGNPNKGKVIGNPQVTVNSDKARVNGSVYGGGSLASTVGNPLVTLTEGSLTQVFGGGKAASVTGAPTVAITGGTVSTGVYGGCDSQGNVSGDITVNVTGGTMGTLTNLQSDTHTTADVYGGGYGQTTTTSGNVEVNIGTANPSSHNDFPKIYGDVYGGSAFGDVNSSTASTPNTTTVNVNNGTLYTATRLVNGFTVYYGGNVYGGGLGQKAVEDDQNTPEDESQPAIEAKVYGLVNVNIGSGVMNSTDPRFTENTYGEAIIQGNVYGCNNANGSPQQNVTVNIYKTYMPADTAYTATYLENDGIHGDPQYVLANVFGGGNEANFQVTEMTATVNIYGCDNTIRRTFGGSNAAASDSVFTMIQGGRIHEAFGGGNGEVSPAHVNGNVTLEIHGGRVDQSFGGSNQQGTITGTSTVTIDSEGGCGESVIEEFFCGGNFADYYGDIDATIDCAAGLHIHNLYGGCKQADVVPNGLQIGNVHLVVNGGTYENIFGGSQGRLADTDPDHPTAESADINGSILLEIYGGTVTNAIYGGSHILGAVKGTITVNIENGNTGCELDLSAADVYGGGNEADYPGLNEGNPITHTPPFNYPQINIKNATVKNVFGGGYKAKVTGNPQIRIKKGSKVLGNVYGGGNMGELIGNPKVIVNGKDDSENPHTIE